MNHPPKKEVKILGTLIVVLIKARNLPNLVRIGKQNPYSILQLGIQRKKTKSIERGGQNPEWDEEFRFEILEDMGVGLGEGVLVNKNGGVKPLPVSAAAGGSKLKVAGGGATPNVGIPNKDGKKIMRLACYADDPKDPKIIGETFIELDDILKKGACDQWFEIQKKGRYAGEVYVEMTWYSNAPPPPKPVTLTKKPTNAGYGGPGSRTEDVDDDKSDGHSNHSRSRRNSSNAPLELDADYPDADIGVLNHSMSNLSVAGGSMRQPPGRAPSPGRHMSLQHHPSVDSMYSDPMRRASYSNAPLPQPGAPSQSHTYGPGEFDALVKQHYASTILSHPRSTSPLPLPQSFTPQPQSIASMPQYSTLNIHSSHPSEYTHTHYGNHYSPGIASPPIHTPQSGAYQPLPQPPLPYPSTAPTPGPWSSSPTPAPPPNQSYIQSQNMGGHPLPIPPPPPSSMGYYPNPTQPGPQAQGFYPSSTPTPPQHPVQHQQGFNFPPPPAPPAELAYSNMNVRGGYYGNGAPPPPIPSATPGIPHAHTPGIPNPPTPGIPSVPSGIANVATPGIPNAGTSGIPEQWHYDYSTRGHPPLPQPPISGSNVGQQQMQGHGHGGHQTQASQMHGQPHSMHSQQGSMSYQPSQIHQHIQGGESTYNGYY